MERHSLLAGLESGRPKEEEEESARHVPRNNDLDSRRRDERIRSCQVAPAAEGKAGFGKAIDYIIAVVVDTADTARDSQQVDPVVEAVEDANTVAADHSHRALATSSLGWHPAAAPVDRVQLHRQQLALMQAAY